MCSPTCVSVCGVCVRDDAVESDLNENHDWLGHSSMWWQNHFDFGICDEIEYIIWDLNQHRDISVVVQIKRLAHCDDDEMMTNQKKERKKKSRTLSAPNSGPFFMRIFNFGKNV